jgi:hypothetical protein
MGNTYIQKSFYCRSLFSGSNLSPETVVQTLTTGDITLNLLRKSRINLRISAYAQLNGHFDFNRTPLAPPGTLIIAHEKPDQRASWDPHGLDGYYLGPTLDHYRCYQVHITKTKGTRIVDTVEIPPAELAMLITSSKDLASIAALELSNALQNPAPAAPFSQIGTAQLQALRQLLDIFLWHFHPVPHSMHPVVTKLLTI